MAGVKGRSGGARPGAGRPRKTPADAWLSGNAGKRGPRAVEKPEAAAKGASDLVGEPKGLTNEEREVWRALAPHALQEGTLTAGTAAAFLWLCRSVLLERKLATAPLAVGGPDHRGMMQRVEGLMARFRLVPDGKPIAAKPKEDGDEWSEFDGPKLVKGA